MRLRRFSIVFLLFLLGDVFALQGGPVQTDYLQFEPADMPDLVNLYTGDFAYSIPLGGVPGPYGSFPISMSYHAAISPQQEASWVGLGWTLNPGAINRTVRGVPDDQFHGGTLGFIYLYTASSSWGVDLGWSNGITSVGLSVNSNGGVGFNATLGPSLNGVAGLGLSVGTDGVGVVAQAKLPGDAVSVNGSVMVGEKGSISVRAGVSVGGKTEVGASVGATYTPGSGITGAAGMSLKREGGFGGGFSVSPHGVRYSANYSYGEPGGTTISVSGTGLSVSNVMSGKGEDKLKQKSFAAVIPTSAGFFSIGFSQSLYQYWLRQATSEYVYGYLYQGGPAVVADDSTNNVLSVPSTGSGKGSVSGAIPWNFNFKGRSLEYVGNPNGDIHSAYDVYSVAASGISGTFRPVAKSYHSLYMSLRTEEKETAPAPYSYILQPNDSAERVQYQDEYIHEDSLYSSVLYAYRYRLDVHHPNRTVYNGGSAPANPKEAVAAGVSPYAYFKTRYLNEANRLIYLATPGDGDRARSRMEFQFIGSNQGYFESEPLESIQNDEDFIYAHNFQREVDGWNHGLIGSKKIEPILEDHVPYGKLEGFRITTGDGSRYIFKQPVRSYLKVDYVINRKRGAPLFIDRKTKNTTDWVEVLFQTYTSIMKFMYTPWEVLDFSGHWDLVCKEGNDGQLQDYFYSYQVDMNPFATQWLLTEVQGADFVDLGGDSINQNLGHQVVLKYSEPIMYRWRSPFAKPDGNPMQAQNARTPRQAMTPKGCSAEKYNAAFGYKELVYLQSIETATHRAEFVLNDSNERADGKGWEAIEDSTTGRIPIYTPASLKLRPMGVLPAEVFDNKLWTQVIRYSLQDIYLNSPLPTEMASRLVGQTVQLVGLGALHQKTFFQASPLSQAYPLGFQLFATSDKTLNAKILSYEKTKGKETQWGLYKLVVDTGAYVSGLFRYLKTSDCTADSLRVYCDASSRDTWFPVGSLMDTAIWLGENATENLADDSTAVLFKKQVFPMVDWSTLFRFKEGDNQMRNLQSIRYCRKDSAGNCGEYYRTFSMGYDYSLQPSTLNSYCRGKYPRSVDEMRNIPPSSAYGVCETDSLANQLYGKLSLRSVTETACRYGQCASLPPFRFGYHSPNASTLRLGSMLSYLLENSRSMAWYIDSNGQTFGDTTLAGMTDVDVTIINTNDQTDEWGLWNWKANEENHKTNQNIADQAGSAWSLRKIVDPAGGVMEIEYERDTYQGESFESDKLFVPVANFSKCNSFSADPAIADKTCLVVTPMYWKDECLAGRSEFWYPGSRNGESYEYLDSLNLNIGSNLYFNLSTSAKTSVDCGFLSLASCDRKTSIAVFGEGMLMDTIFLSRRRVEALNLLSDSILASRDFQEVESSRTALILVLDRSWGELTNSLLRNASRIASNDGGWTIQNSNRFGSLMIPQVNDTLKGGDVRVKRLSRYDMGVQQTTEYQYEFPEYDENGDLIHIYAGETPQLPDSAYTGLLASRLMPTKYNWALPNLDVKPKSRVVGIGDEDLYYLPSGKIAYPRVQIRNLVDEEEANGYTEFKYVTAQTGIPVEYVAPIRDQLKKFVRLNLNLWIRSNIWDGWSFSQNHRKIRVTAVDASGNQKSREVFLSEDDPESVFFYEDSMGFNPRQLRKLIFVNSPFTVAETLSVDSVPFTEYNEIWATVKMDIPPLVCTLDPFPSFSLSCNVEYDEKIVEVELLRIRSQALGYVPVLYKDVSYASESVFYSVRKQSNKGKALSCTTTVDFESRVRYHDLSVFVGKTISTGFYRQRGEHHIPVRLDSMVYSVQVPSVRAEALADNDWNRAHLGRQQESWGYTKSLDCKRDDKECKENFGRLFALRDQKYSKDLDVVRYPAYVTETVTRTGFNNQDTTRDDWKLLPQRTTNHWFDPVTGSPTLTVAHADKGLYGSYVRDVEMRKATKVTPHWYAAAQGHDSSVATEMFLRNMFSQNFKEEVFSWDVVSATLSPDVLPRSQLRHVKLTPFAYATTLWPDSVNQMVQGFRIPLVGLGEFSSKEDPSTLTGDFSAYQFVTPPLDSFAGTEILQINQYSRVLEQQDVLGRRLSTYYSDDGMFQIGVFYPTERTTTGLWVSTQENGDDFFSGHTWQTALSNLSGAQVVEFQAYAAQPLNASVSLPGNSQTVSLSKGLKAYRVVLHPGGDGTLSVNFQGAVNLRYVRTYPVGAQAKTYRYDRYGSMIQAVDERNVSTYFEYDVFGNLQQTRNDDGVVFKSHSREMMNQEGN